MLLLSMYVPGNMKEPNPIVITATRLRIVNDLASLYQNRAVSCFTPMMIDLDEKIDEVGKK